MAQLVKNPLAMWETWAGKIPWRRERLPTPVFWPGEFHGLFQGVTKSQTWLSDFHSDGRTEGQKGTRLCAWYLCLYGGVLATQGWAVGFFSIPHQIFCSSNRNKKLTTLIEKGKRTDGLPPLDPKTYLQLSFKLHISSPFIL